MDRVIAVVAILPMLWAAYYRYEHYGLNLPVIYYFVNTMSNAVAIGALLFSVWARLSLRRNMGFVPAQREIVTAGASAADSPRAARRTVRNNPSPCRN